MLRVNKLTTAARQHTLSKVAGAFSSYFNACEALFLQLFDTLLSLM